MKQLLAGLMVIAACSSSTRRSNDSFAAASAASVAAPRAETMEYDIVLGGRTAGRVAIVWHADGSSEEDLEFDDRGSGPKTHARLQLGADGLPDRFELSGHDYRRREVHEQVICDMNRCRWDGEDERGEGPRGFYIPSNPTLSTSRAILRGALEAGGVPLLPGGRLRAAAIAETTLARDGAAVHVRAIEFSGSSFEPWVEWYDDAGAPFAEVDDFGAAIREGWRGAIPRRMRPAAR